MKPPGVELHIAELAVDPAEGLGSLEPEHLKATVERELRWLIAERGLPAGFSYPSRTGGWIDGGDFTVAAEAGVPAIGACIARGIRRGLTAVDEAFQDRDNKEER